MGSLSARSSLLSLPPALLPPALLAFPLSFDNPEGRINDDEWISDDEERGKDVDLLLLMLLQSRTIICLTSSDQLLLYV